VNEQVASLYAEIGLKISGALRGLRDFRTRLQDAQSRLKTVRDQSKITQTALNLGLTAGLTALGRTAVGAFADAETAMNVFKLVTHATTGEMADASAAIEAIAHDLQLPGITRKDAAEALAALGNAGLSARDAIDALRPTLLLAEAGQIKAAEAADILAASLSGFKLPGSEAARVVDLIAGAALAAQGTVQDVGEAFRVAGPVFAAAGVPIENLATLYAELAKNGITGANAGEQLKTMMLRLIAPSEEAAALMRAMGIHVYDAQGKMRDFRDIIKDFQAGLAPLTEAQRNQRLATIFGSEAVSAAAIIFQKEGVPGFDEMKTAVTEAGTAQKLATAKTEGLAGATGGLAKAIDTAATGAVKPFEEDIKTLAGALAGAVLAFDALDGGTKKLIITGAAIILSLGTLGVVVGAVSTIVGNLVMAASTLWSWFGVLVSVGGDLAGVFGALLSPIGFAALSLAGFVVGVIWAWENIGKLNDAVAALTGVRVDFSFIFQSVPLLREIVGAWESLKRFEHAIDDLNGALQRISGVRVDFSSIFHGIPIIGQILDAWDNLKRLGLLPGGSGGSSSWNGQGPAPRTVTIGGGSVPAMAGGGSARAGQPVWVGERGPELFVPDRGGTVVPNGAGGTTNANFYGPVFGFSDVKDMIVRALDEARREGRVPAGA
jgi:TP901 family phage tail tape measure protein